MSGSLIYTLLQNKCNLQEPAFLLGKSVACHSIFNGDKFVRVFPDRVIKTMATRVTIVVPPSALPFLFFVDEREDSPLDWFHDIFSFNKQECVTCSWRKLKEDFGKTTT